MYNTTEPFLIGCGAGFSGDRVDAPGPVVRHLAATGKPAALMLETLGERTLALAQKARKRDFRKGYEPLLESLVAPILNECMAATIPIISNFGAANPAGAAEAISQIAKRAGLRKPRIAVIEGDDLKDQLLSLPLVPWENESDEDIDERHLIAANAYIGAFPIAEALAAGAEVVVTGRIADPALALGPLINHFGWGPQDWDLLASGTVAGHLLECGSQVSGGYFADPGKKDVPDMASIGFPVAEIREDGTMTVTKADATGGLVDERTVKEQLLYEVHDPSAYITPDVVVDFTAVNVEKVQENSVLVAGVRGKPATSQLKVTVSLDGGWLGEGEISYAGPNARQRAELAADTLLNRLEARDLNMRRRIDLIGVTSIFDNDLGTIRARSDGSYDDVRLRLAVEGADRTQVEAATQEVLALYCCGPAGGGGVRRNHVSRIHTCSYLVPKIHVKSRMRIL